LQLSTLTNPQQPCSSKISGHEPGRAIRTLGAFIEGERLISREAFQECELAHMQLKQLRYVMLMQALNVEGLSGDAAREVAGRYQASLAKADEMMEQIRKWLSN